MPELQSLEQEPEKHIGLFGALSIGIGGMVGGGLFAIMGLALFYGRSGVGVSFLLAGLVALLTGYSYVKLTEHFKDKGGSVTYITKTIPNTHLASWLNILLMLSYIVITSLYAVILAAYFTIFFQSSTTGVISHLAISLSLILAATLNFLSEKYVSRAETWIVFIKLLIIVAFLILGFRKIEGSNFALPNWPNFLVLAETAGLLFLAYEGFELIANSAHKINKPEKNISRAIFISIIVTIFIYIAVAIVAVGSLPFSTITSFSGHILANAAKAIYPPFGAEIMAVAAVLASLSAETATFFGTSRMFLVLSEYKHLPTLFSKNYREEMSIWGIVVMLVSTLLISNFMDIESIATMGSAGFLLIFAMINITCYIRAKEVNSKRWVSLLGVIAAALGFAVLVYHAAITHPKHIISLAVMIGLSGLLTLAFQKFSNQSS